jgi:chromosome segregation ATPase
MSTESLLREVRILREQTFAAIDTARELLKNHSAQLENLEERLERLERKLNEEAASIQAPR